MNFTSPHFLWALIALIIPVLIHLFNFQRTIKVYFSNNYFFHNIKKKIGFRSKLKQYLVLLSRIFFLFFLVLAFAKPFIPAKEQTIEPHNDIIFYLDNSFSMSTQTAEKIKALDVGIQFIRQMIESLPSDAQYKLLTNNFVSFSPSFKTSNKILDQLTQIRLSPFSLTAEEIVQKIKINNKAKGDVFWISDFQKSTFGSSEHFAPDTSVTWHLVLITLHQKTNTYIDSVYLENPFSIEGKKNKIKVKIANIGQQKKDTLTVKLIINNIQSGIASVFLEPSYVAEISFDLTSNFKGINEAKISINDPFTQFDNDFYFALNFSNTVHIVEIQSDPKNTYIKNVFGNKKLFSYTSFLSTNVDYSTLKKADLIILNGLNYINKSLMLALIKLLNSKKMLFIPGNKPHLTSYKKLLKWPHLKMGRHDTMIPLDKPDLQNPFFKGVFKEQTDYLRMPQAIKLLDLGVDRNALLRFKDTSPFLSQRNNIFVLASPLKKEYTNFHRYALFVPTMYKIAFSTNNPNQTLYHTFTTNLVVLQTDHLLGHNPIQLVGNTKIIPPQHRVGKKVFLEIPKFSMTPGFFYMQQLQDTLGLLAVNLDKQESDLRQYGVQEIFSLYGHHHNTSVFEILDTKQITHEIKKRYLEISLWKFALLLSLFFLMVEILLLRYLN